MDIQYQPFTMAHYDAVVSLWRDTEGIGLSAADGRDEIAAYLARNPGMSFVCFADTELAGAVLAGHDGRRGFLHHLAVSQKHRRRGIGKALAQRALAALSEHGMAKCHIMVFATNPDGLTFWRQLGFTVRTDVALMSADLK